MGGTTITIQEDNLLSALNKLQMQKEEIEGTFCLFLDSITVLGKDKNKKYYAIGNKGIEYRVGTDFATQKLYKDIIIFAHFGK